ncbi:hypothetical protein BV898_06669 [Hypsibius exemplaris]|uniref:Histone-lysine N-methyltransferase SETMAR n=1 Tax=Hypsibius exemplaris TaxID=2072580 RepID=A0A1W0WVM4_HYPEX|nr:hypothetical protein BV898_06669 [Hypsibius exemplaris]
MQRDKHALRGAAFNDFSNGQTTLETLKRLKNTWSFCTFNSYCVEILSRVQKRKKDAGDVSSPGLPATAVIPCNIEAVDRYITENPRATWEEIQVEIGISSAALNIILHHKLGLRKLCARWVPHMLLEGKKLARADFAVKMLNGCRKNPELFLKRILTGDESWMY